MTFEIRVGPPHLTLHQGYALVVREPDEQIRAADDNVYESWLRMAQVYDALGRYERAAELRSKAASLFERFNAAFWNEAEGFTPLRSTGTRNKFFQSRPIQVSVSSPALFRRIGRAASPIG